MTTWMIVEDEPDIYALLLAMFDVWGIEGIAFVDGEEAFRWMTDVENGMYLKEAPELALVDIRLPGDISGPEVGARLRRHATLGDPVIVLITAYRMSKADEEVVRQEAGADLLFYKPLPDLGELRAKLDAAVVRRRESRGRSPATREEAAARQDAAEPAAHDGQASGLPFGPALRAHEHQQASEASVEPIERKQDE